MNVVYLEGTPEGEHLRAEIFPDGIRLVLSVRNPALDGTPLRLRPIYPAVWERRVAWLSQEQWLAVAAELKGSGGAKGVGHGGGA